MQCGEITKTFLGSVQGVVKMTWYDGRF